MSREIDVKALVSHLVRGDGADRCRICMGDTSEGQVYLGDTVMMDGERPVTLAELLEVITGVEVLEAADLPNGICTICSGAAIDAANFLVLCRQADNKWNTTIELLECLPEKVPDGCQVVYAFLQNDQLIVTANEVEKSEELPILESKGDHLAVLPVEQIVIEKQLKKVRKKFKILYCQCPFCHKKFKYAEHLSHHLKESADYNRACYVCGKIMNRDDLVEHLKHVHTIRPYDCKKCPALFSSANKLQCHMEVDHVKGACTCGDCGRSFKSAQAYHAHQSIHMSKPCPGCDKLFRNKTCYLHHVRTCCNLNKHREDMHRTKHKVMVEVKNQLSMKKVKVGLRGSSQNECICDYCNKRFAGKKFVAAHIQIVHTKNTHSPCPYCGKFLAAARMSTHLKNHETTPTFKCQHCNITLKTRLGYIQHLRLHTGERPYTCQQCGETFSASSRRSEHMRRVHGTDVELRHACKLCPARFALPFRLRKHMSSVHSEGEKTVFECPECHEKFSSCRGLVHHSRKHQKGIIRKPRRTIVPMKVFSKIID